MSIRPSFFSVTRWQRLSIGTILLGILLLGGLFTVWAIQREDRQMREEMLRQTSLVAQGIPLDQVKALSGTVADEQKPEYRRLKTQLMAAQQINPLWKWIYLMNRNPEGTVYFQVDSEDFDAPDPSPPGQTYEEASAILQAVFDKRKTTTEGPLMDRWGVWVSAFVPLTDPKTGHLITVVGIDIEASAWRSKTLRAGIVPLLLTLSLSVILLLAHFLRRRTDDHRHPIKKRWRHLEACLTSAIGLTLTLTVVWLARSIETRYTQQAFESLAHLKSGYVLNTLTSLRNSEIESLSRFIENSDWVTRDEFHRFSDYLGQMPEVMNWAWIPAVKAEDKNAFEQMVHSQIPGGYRIWEEDPTGQPIPALRREIYYPILHIESAPSSPEYKLLPGFDLGSLESIRSILNETAQQNLIAATDFPSLRSSPSTPSILLIFRPVRDSNPPYSLKGFAMAALDLGRVIQTLVRTKNEDDPLISIHLIQLWAQHPPQHLASVGNSASPFDLTSPLTRPMTFSRPILAFGQTFVVTALPTPDFIARHSTYLSWIVLLAGLSITLASALVISNVSHRHEDMERLVSERTYELASSLRRFDQLAKQSRTFTWEMDSTGCYTDLSPVVEDVLGYRPSQCIGTKCFHDFHPDEGRELFKTKILRVLNRGLPFLDFIHPMVTASGKTLWVSTSGMPLLNATGNCRGYQGTSKDITERKMTEESMEALAQQNAESVERYATLISASNTGAWEYHDDTAYMWASPEYFAMLGRHSTDFDVASGQPNIDAVWLNLLHPDDKERARTYFVEYTKNPEGMYQHTFRMRHADGHWVWILSRGRALRDLSGKPTAVVLGTHIDISETKRSEMALRESEQKYRMLTESMKDVVWTLDAETLRYTYISPSLTKLTAYTPEEVMPHPLGFTMPTEAREELRAVIRRRAADLRIGKISPDTFFTDEIPLPHKNGDIRITEAVSRYGINTHTGRIEVHGVTRDITERKRAEAEREQLTRAIEQSGETIVITDAKGSILYVNPAFTKVTGFSREEALGQNPRILRSGEHDTAFYRAMWDTINAGRVWEGQVINRTKSGTLFTEQATISPVRDPDGHIVNFVCVKRDITTQLHDQQEKENLQSQLLQAQKMESIGRLAGGVAHDFNNMLQAILGYTEMALEQVEPDKPLHFDLLEIQKAARRSSLLTRQLQAFARKQSIVPKVLDLNQAVEGMSDMLRRLIGGEIGLEWRPGKGLGLVKMDPGQLDQIVTNLCVNARDAIGKNGHIVLETRNTTLGETAHGMHGEIPPGNYVVLSVVDDGCGMTKEVIDHIFEPFFTTKQTGKGTGLGLATVYGIVRQNQGGVRVQSKPNQGTAFQIFLPRHAGESPTPETTGVSKPLPKSNGQTILLVEDEETILQATRRMLESLGYTVLATASPEEALRLAHDPKNSIHLLLTDVIMPEMTGPDLVQRLLKDLPQLPFLYMSGYTANLLEEKGVREDSANFIQKPFSREILAQKVQSVFGIA